MTSPGDDYPGPTPGEQVGREVDRLDDLARGGRGRWRRDNWNRTPGGCGSVIATLTLAGVATLVAAVWT